MPKFKILKQPHITEKALNDAAEKNVYTFIVDRKANKNQIKQAVEEGFGVSVERIRTGMIRGELKSRGGMRRMPKKTPDRKKAYVKLQEGDSIEAFEIGG